MIISYLINSFYRLGVHLVLRLSVEGLPHHAGLLLTLVYNQVLAQEMFAAILLEALIDTLMAWR